MNSIKRRIIFDENFYEIKKGDDKIYLPSVTTYLEAYPKGYAFYKWLMNTKEPEHVRDEAGQIGSEIHKLIERVLNGETVKEAETSRLIVWEKFLCWCNFAKDYELKPIKSEYIVCDLENQYAGTVDCVGYLKPNKLSISEEELIVMDWKSGGVYPEAELQVSAYAKAYNKMNGTEIKSCIIVELDKTLNQKGYRVHLISNIEDRFNMFLNVQKIWWDVNKNRKPKYLFYPIEVNLDFIYNNKIIEVLP